MPVYTLDQIKHTYGERTILQIGNFAIDSGEILAIVGPSGAGKSTLLRLLGLLEVPTTGTISVNVDGHHFTTDKVSIQQRRQIAMVFQRPFLLSRSVHDNISYGLQIRGIKNADLVQEALARVSLTDLANNKAHTLSGGEMQRVAVARALVIAPQILLLDEPTANLDPYNVRIIEDLIREQHEQFKTTIILVTHNIFQAQRLATRVALVLNGEIIEVAPKDKFFNSPDDPRTQAFLSGELVY